MFLQNKYTFWYFYIIYKAKGQNREKSKVNYYEMHHIIPKSLCKEYSNLKLHPCNGVLLTAREHFICHWLLCKMCILKNNKIKMMKAFSCLRQNDSRSQQRIYNSKQYEILKIYHIKSLIGVKRKPEHVEKWAAKMRGRPLTQEAKENMKGKNKDKILIYSAKDDKIMKKIKIEEFDNDEYKDFVVGSPKWLNDKRNLTKMKKGDKHSTETKSKMSHSRKKKISSGELKTSFQINNPSSRKCTNGNEMFLSVTEMAKSISVTYEVAYYRIRSEKEKYKNYTFI